METVRREYISNLIPDRIRNSHKGTYGRVALLGGSEEYSGAIRLSVMALAALKSGAGLATVAVPRFLVPIISHNILETTIYPIDSDEREVIFNKSNIDVLINKYDVLTCGMGIGKSKGAHDIVYYIIRNYRGRLVLDADALNIVAENINILDEAKCRIVITPHMAEFKRLCEAESERNFSLEEIECNKKEYIKKIIAKYNVIVLLKGPCTVIAKKEDSVKCVVNENSNYEIVKEKDNIYIFAYVDRGTPGMATAGSGDVLSGIITGFLGYMVDEFDATIVSAYINGLAGELAAIDEGEISMTASDTVRHISQAIKMLKE